MSTGDKGRAPSRQPGASQGVFGITTVAEMFGISVQTLRLYETRGLLEPARTEGGTRRYSADDVDRVQRIGDLIGAGLNLAGVAMVLDLEDQNTELRDAQPSGPRGGAHQSSGEGRVAAAHRRPVAERDSVQRSAADRRSRP